MLFCLWFFRIIAKPFWGLCDLAFMTQNLLVYLNDSERVTPKCTFFSLIVGEDLVLDLRLYVSCVFFVMPQM